MIRIVLKFGVTLLLLVTTNISVCSQNQTFIQKTCEAGVVFDDPSQRIEFSFKEPYHFAMHYGANTYPQYVGYFISHDTLTITRSDYMKTYHRPQFKIITLTAKELKLEALNEAAMYILNCRLGSHNTCGEELKTNANERQLKEDALRTTIQFVPTT